MKYFVVKDGKIRKEIASPDLAKEGEAVIEFKGDEEDFKIKELVIHSGEISRLFLGVTKSKKIKKGEIASDA